MIGWGILGLVLCIFVAFWPARVASRKGYSFFGWFVVSIFFWWITLFVVYGVLKDKNRTAQDIADEKAVDKVLDREEKNAK